MTCLTRRLAADQIPPPSLLAVRKRTYDGRMLIEQANDKDAVSRSIARLTARLQEVQDVANRVLGGGFSIPLHMIELRVQVKTAKKIMGYGNVDWDFPDAIVPLLATALLQWRMEKVTILESLKARVIDESVLKHHIDEVETLDELVAQPWVAGTAPLRMPELADYLALEYVEGETRREWETSVREYDEKFHTLQAPSQLWRDLEYFRQACGWRGRLIGLAFIDIDDFGLYNQRFTFPVVDRNVLPYFMRTLESAVFGRGFGYRFGGDEYVLCLPNTHHGEMLRFLDALRRQLAEATYEGIDRRMTVSIGFVMVSPSAVLTDREYFDRASYAKDQAKDLGKDRIGGWAEGETRLPHANAMVLAPGS
jgi:diguanylate cyclase (GGDEF)-like protein